MSVLRDRRAPGLISTQRLLVSLALGTATACAQEWLPPQNLTPGMTDAIRPAVAAEDGGRVLVLFEATGQNIFCWNSTLDAVEFVTPGVFARVAARGDRVACAYSADWHIWVRERNLDGTWTDPVNVSLVLDPSGPTDCVLPDIVLGADGRLHVVWVGKNFARAEVVWYALHDGAQWSKPVQLSLGPVNGYAPPRLSTMLDGRPVVYYGAGPTDDITLQLLVHDGAGWGHEVVPYPGGVRGDLDVDFDGNVHLIWERSAHVYYGRRTVAGEYEAQVPLSEAYNASYLGGLVARRADAVWVFWRKADAPAEGVVRHWNGLAWSAPTPVTGGQDPVHLTAGSDTAGNPFAVWSYDWQIRLARRSTSLPTPTPDLTPSRTPTLTASPTLTPTHTLSPTPSVTNTSRPTRTPTPTPAADQGMLRLW